jgi:hypothetical protein
MTLRRSLIHGLLLVLVTALLGACSTGSAGNGDTGKGTGTGKDTSKDPQQAALSYAKCMRENGVDIPDPKQAGDGSGNVVLGPGSGKDPKFKAAQEACAKHAKDMGGFAADGGPSEADKQRLVEQAKCMREQGFDMPDPDFSGGTGTVDLPVPSDAQGKAEWEKAFEGCRKKKASW